MADEMTGTCGCRLSIPSRERANAVIFTADFSEAAAINQLGRGTELPTAVSGHNTYWWWSPGKPRATTMLAVAPGLDHAGDYAAYLVLVQVLGRLV